MNYLTKSPAQEKAERIAARAQELASHVESTLKAMFGAITQDSDPQAILDVFGTNAAKVLADYAAMQQAVASINPNSSVLAPDAAMFAPNQDGTVVYTAPPEPEPEPETPEQ
jgi:hypothetical protein